MVVLALAAVLAVAAVIVYWSWRHGPEHDLSGKVVLLTGAGGGLGRLLAEDLAARGCRLACVDVAEGPNEETASMVRAHGQANTTKLLARAYTVDLRNGEDISALVESVVNDFGQVDILVNCAGQLQAGAVWELTDDQTDQLLDVNLRACILLVKYALPHMRARGEGHIVTVGSVAAIFATRKMSVYAASKAGLSRFMQCLYFDLRRDGLGDKIHVTTIEPYLINTLPHLEASFKSRRPVAKLLLGYLEAKATARTICHCIATRQHLVTLPAHLGVLANILRHTPWTVQAYVLEKLARPDKRPPYPYHARHASLDAALMYELLSKGYDLHEDPEAVCRALRAENLAKGIALPHDYSPFRQSIRKFYSSRGQSVPDAVKSVFAL
ncbi:uncharacterized oxidoreductase SERP2049-like [Thrips palmi]|uniref:Uncharacterized oxidoreductase SERP2049-like n=1 Tax=Thrips palmi TaxID=161013 RepID=A0A6P9A7G6_THRPL|nr:uncharacterized oxidoreductase SERP2049-like [Thrips palmi]